MAKSLDQIVEEARQKLGLPPEMAANRVYRVDQLVNPLPNDGHPVDANPVQWAKRGIVIAMMAQTRANTDAEAGGTEFRLQFAGQIDFITNGKAGQFMSVQACSGKSRNYYPIENPCSKAVPWLVSWRQFSASATVVPDLYFSVLELLGAAGDE